MSLLSGEFGSLSISVLHAQMLHAPSPKLHFVSFWFIFYAVFKALIKAVFTWNRYTNWFQSCTHIAIDFWIYWPKINYKNTDAYLSKTAMIDISFHWSNVMTVPECDRANKPYDRSHWDRMYGTRCPYLVAHCTWCGLISIHLPSANVEPFPQW